MNKEQDRPRRLAGFRRPHPLAIHPQGNVAFLGPVFAAPDLAALGTRRARAWRRQGAGETSGHEAKPGPLDDRAPRQRMIELFHGVLQSDEVFFSDFYAAQQPARCRNSRELGEYYSKPRRFAEVTLRCSAQQPEPYRDREQIEKVRQLDPLEFLRAVGAAGAHTICARAVGANRPAVRLTSLL